MRRRSNLTVLRRHPLPDRKGRIDRRPRQFLRLQSGPNRRASTESGAESLPPILASPGPEASQTRLKAAWLARLCFNAITRATHPPLAAKAEAFLKQWIVAWLRSAKGAARTAGRVGNSLAPHSVSREFLKRAERFRNSERLAIAYFVYVAAIAPFYISKPWRAWLLAAAVALGLWLMAAWTPIARDLAPLGATLAAYREMNWFASTPHDHHLERAW